MSRFKQGQVITLKSDKSITGAIVNIMEEYPETRYQVFTAAGIHLKILKVMKQNETNVIANWMRIRR